MAHHARVAAQRRGDGGKNDITGIDLAPRLALNHLVNANHALRASLSKAVRTPVIFEDRADYKVTFDHCSITCIWATAIFRPKPSSPANWVISELSRRRICQWI